MKQKKVKRGDLVYETDKYVYNFQQFEAITSFTKNIFYNKINLDEADKAQIDLLNDFLDFQKGARARDIKNKKLKRDNVGSIDALC